MMCCRRMFFDNAENPKFLWKKSRRLLKDLRIIFCSVLCIFFIHLRVLCLEICQKFGCKCWQYLVLLSTRKIKKKNEENLKIQMINTISVLKTSDRTRSRNLNGCIVSLWPSSSSVTESTLMVFMSLQMHITALADVWCFIMHPPHLVCFFFYHNMTSSVIKV